MKETSYAIKDRLGIHSRFAMRLTDEMKKFSSEISVVRGNDKCDGKNLYGVMSLQVKTGEIITVRAAGQDEEAAIKAARDFLNRNL
jgi:phosphotransferase system HPr (HPr) family protein